MKPDGERRVQTVCLVILATTAASATLYWLAPVMIPFVLAVFFAFILSPLIELQVTRLRMPRAAAIAATLALAFLLFGGVAALVSASVGQLAANADGYQMKATELMNMAAAALPLERFGIDAAAVSDPLESAGSICQRRSRQTAGNPRSLSPCTCMSGIRSLGSSSLLFETMCRIPNSCSHAWPRA